MLNSDKVKNYGDNFIENIKAEKNKKYIRSFYENISVKFRKFVLKISSN